MPNNDALRLADYVKKQIKSGYDIATIRNFLISNGYSSRLVDESIDLIYSSNSNRNEKSFPRTQSNQSSNHKLLLISLLGLIIIAGLIYVLIKVLSPNSSSSYNNPDQTLDKTPLGSKNSQIDSNSFGSNDNNNQNNTDLINPTNEVTASNNQINTDNNNIISLDASNQQFDPTLLEIEDLIEKNSESESVNLCKGIKDEYKMNSCYKKVAIKFDKPDYCENINNSNLKDNCYFIFAFTGKSQYCDKIQDTYQKLTCNSYGKAQQESNPQ